MKTIKTILLCFICVPAVLCANDITYPYHATPERSAAVMGGASKVQLGMSVKQVEAVLGVPDEKNNTFDRIKAPQARKIGYSHTYLLQRHRPDGSVLQKNEKYIRLHFGLDDQLRQIDNQTK